VAQKSAGRLKFGKQLKLASVVQRELGTFVEKITPAGNQTFAADWREGQHDDLVLAVALALWLGEKTFCGPWTAAPDPSCRGLMAEIAEEIYGRSEREARRQLEEAEEGPSAGEFYGLRDL